MSLVLSDQPAERAILAGIFQHGSSVYFDIADMIQESTFTEETHCILFKCVQHIFQQDDVATIDISLLHSAAQTLGFYHLISKQEEIRYIRALFDFPINALNVRKFAAKIRKLEIAKLLHKQLGKAQDKMLDVNGDENIAQILGIAEDAVLDFSSLLNDDDNTPVRLGENIHEYLQYLIENPVEQLGISTGFPAWDQSIGGGLRQATINVIAARPKVGKAQSLNSIVYTNTGPKYMKDICVGDYICHPNGGLTTVTGIYPQGKKLKYEIIFSDGSKTECCDEHLWYVKHRRKSTYQILSLKHIMEYKSKYHPNTQMNSLIDGDRPRWQIPLTKPLQFLHKSLCIDAYTMGLLLGDGSFRNGVSFTTVDNELLQELQNSLKPQYKLRKDKITYHIIKQKRTGCQSNIYIDTMRKYKLWMCTSHEKFIPDDYLYNSRTNRIALLQGLMDTDGSIGTNGSCEYSTVSIQLAKDVQILIQSLGGICKIKSRTTSCNNKQFNSFRLRISFNDNSICFKLPRKLSRCMVRTKPSLKRSIVDIKPVGYDDMQCISVKAQDGLYLTDNFIVTHNTVLSDNIGYNITLQGIPVLNMDTEMTKEDHIHRTLAMMNEIPINDIETGTFGQKEDWKSKVLASGEQLENLPYDYKNIAGKPFEEQLAIMRRWITREVGLNTDGTAKPCVVIYDYLKLMDTQGMSQDLKEYQLLGFMMTTLHNFASRYKIPIIAFMQLNRDGITKESTDAASGSDRIIWLCSNFTIFKYKSEEEVIEDGDKMGNRKLVPIVARHGAGLDYRDYINCNMKGWCAKVEEGKTKFELMAEQQELDDGFITDESDDDRRLF